MTHNVQKRPYRATPISKIKPEDILREQHEKITLAIDIAKNNMVAAFTDQKQNVIKTIKWHHPKQHHEFIALLKHLQLHTPIEAVMEPTGPYGIALRHHIMAQNIPVFMANPKHVHDAKELYDGVPSAHDAKACAIIAFLHHTGKTRQFRPQNKAQRALKSYTSILYRYEKLFRNQQRQLHSLFAIFWPEIIDIIRTRNKSILTLLAEMGGPEAIAKNKAKARNILKTASKNSISSAKIDNIIKAAENTTGQSMLPEERLQIQMLAKDALHTREAVMSARKSIEARVQENEQNSALIQMLGKVTTGVLLAELGEIRQYASPASLVRAMGLNLRENSSGKLKGKLRITKRGSPRCRFYLFFAAFRMVYQNPIIRAWYEKKCTRTNSKLVAMVAVMRKLAKAIWYVAQGEAFDANKLYDTTKLQVHDQEKQENNQEDIYLPL